jgi:glycosyltransferase involved in cell wall biosynthesis
VRDHPVEIVVVDDGSTDATADRAHQAGATVLRLGENRGLGAAVREGLALGVRRDAAAIAFCDADGEYAPEELERLVAPVLDGDADYVVGSRFAGTIRSMRPHRRFGNVVLTRIVRFMVRQPVTDGQSGYRALSPGAAANAVINHDFNYAQVLTLDLLGKGYRYREVPISYAFRTTGRSFVRLGTYLRKVVPAWYRELNDPGDAAIELLDVEVDVDLDAAPARAPQSSTTLPANESVAARQASSSNEPSARSASAAAQPIASA